MPQRGPFPTKNNRATAEEQILVIRMRPDH